MERKICVIGLGYVGLPVALAFAKKFKNVKGFDINKEKVQELSRGYDRTGETSDEDLKSTTLTFTADACALKDRDFFIIAVPTPVDQARRPDLTPVIKATETIGQIMKKGSIIVYESTVYPGVTEEICGPILAKTSGFVQGKDFKLGYSPERINPGDKEHRLQNIIKVVSGEDAETLNEVANIYGSIINAGIHRAASIKVAEAAKVIENTQRDLNIALMNELAIIFDKIGIATSDVLEAASTKWNFLSFRPGLVGGHCIGVDPYYLTYKAEELGYHPQVILAGRRINDSMGKFIAEQTIKLMVRANKNICCSRVGVMGLTFKEDVPDLRNSRVPDIIFELKQYGCSMLVHDPIGDPSVAKKEYGIDLCYWSEFKNLDAIIMSVAHKEYKKQGISDLSARLKDNEKGVIVDVKSIFQSTDLPENIIYWSL